MWPHNRSDNIEGIFHIGHPVPDCFICCILKRPGATAYRPHFSPQQPHSIYIQLLAPDIFLSHVNDTLKPELGTCGCGSYAMLPGPCLSYNSSLPDSLAQYEIIIKDFYLTRC